MIKYLFFSKGFTLVELLVSISVIGILAAVILVSINPGEQMAKSRDAGKKNAMSELSRAVSSYYYVSGAWPDHNANNQWITRLKNTYNELKSEVPRIGSTNYDCSSDYELTPGSMSVGWGSTNQNGYCYWVNVTEKEAIIFARLESKTEYGKCGGQIPYYTWHSIRNTLCLYCGINNLGVVYYNYCNSVQ